MSAAGEDRSTWNPLMHISVAKASPRLDVFVLPVERSMDAKLLGR